MTSDLVVIPVADRVRWEAVALESGVPSHGWSFCAALGDSGPSPSLARISHQGSVLIMPFVERPWADTVDIATITTVSGASWTAPDAVVLDSWSRHGASQGWIAGYLQFRPGTELSGVPAARPGNSVFLIDLRVGDVLAGASTIVRRKLNRALTAGARLEDDRRLLEEAVVRLYPETLLRVRARANYSYSEQTLRRWIRDPRSLVLGASLGERIEACVLFLVSSNQAEYHLGASSDEGRSLQAWLLHAGMVRLREMGVAVLNLGGGVRRGDGLFQFKAKFGGEQCTLHAVRQIYRPDVYRRLVDDAGVSADEPWFPAYRAQAADDHGPARWPGADDPSQAPGGGRMNTVADHPGRAAGKTKRSSDPV